MKTRAFKKPLFNKKEKGRRKKMKKEAISKLISEAAPILMKLIGFILPEGFKFSYTLDLAERASQMEVRSTLGF